MEEKRLLINLKFEMKLLCSLTLIRLYILFDISRKTKFDKYKETFKGRWFNNKFKIRVNIGFNLLLYVDGRVMSKKKYNGREMKFFK
jgi:hypothetical protein